MTCTHRPGDPNCGSHPDNVRRRTEQAHAERISELKSRIAILEAELAAGAHDASNYEILDADRTDRYLVVRVKYPSCRRCSYEGMKILVFRNVTEIDVMRWKVIDPHFRDPDEKDPPTHAPPPVARFPATMGGGRTPSTTPPRKRDVRRREGWLPGVTFHNISEICSW